jgi:hypothetical protein
MGNVNLQHLKWGVPAGAFPCWIIDESERLNALRNKRTFPDYSPPRYFIMTKRLDNNFIEGQVGCIGQKPHVHYANFHDEFKKYENREPIYLSFDRVSLFRVVEIQPTTPLTFILRRIDDPKAIVVNQVFMIMPFGYPELNSLYKDYLKPFLKKELMIDIYRADDFNGNDVIIDTIYTQMEQAEIIISDTTHPNKNVFYELGWAAAKDKEIISIRDKAIKGSDFFDRAHIRYTRYSMSDIPEFLEYLKNDIIAIRAKVNSKS